MHRGRRWQRHVAVLKCRPNWDDDGRLEGRRRRAEATLRARGKIDSDGRLAVTSVTAVTTVTVAARTVTVTIEWRKGINGRYFVN